MLSSGCKLVSYPYVIVMFITTLSLGGFLSNNGLAESHSLGLMVSFFPIILVSLVSGHWFWLNKSELQIGLVILLATLVHFVAVAVFSAVGPLDYLMNGVGSRFILSYVLLIVMLWSAFQMERYLALLSRRNLRRLLNTVYRCLVVLAILSVPFHILDLVSRKQMLIFSEPSHFALVFGPFYLYKIFTSSHRLTHLLICLSLALMLQNVTLIVFALLGYFLSLRLSRFKMLVRGALFVILAFALYTYFAAYDNFMTDRLFLSPESENLSVLVLLSGYQRAYLTIFEWSYIGVGFQQMGMVGPIGSIQSSIELIAGATMNLLDGSTFFSKITVEFGVFGVVVVLTYLQKCWVILRRLGSLGKNSPTELFYALCFLGFFIVFFIRGSGYFTPSTFLFIIALIGLKRVSKKNTVEE